MTNKELIDKIRNEILHLKMKELQRTNGVNSGADVYLSSYAVLSILSNALTEESEDERARKAALEGIEYLERKLCWDAICDTDILDVKEYLEKQKKPENTSASTMAPSCWEVEQKESLRDFIDDFPYSDEQKEQKPAEKQDYSDLTDLERVIHRGFISAGVENVPVTIIKETAKECLAQMKPAWSEEDEDFINMLILHFNYLIDKGGDSVETYKSYREKLKSLRPSWKPTEEQMGALQHAIDACESEWAYQDDELRSLLNDIKKL